MLSRLQCQTIVGLDSSSLKVSVRELFGVGISCNTADICGFGDKIEADGVAACGDGLGMGRDGGMVLGKLRGVCPRAAL